MRQAWHAQTGRPARVEMPPDTDLVGHGVRLLWRLRGSMDHAAPRFVLLANITFGEDTCGSKLGESASPHLVSGRTFVAIVAATACGLNLGAEG